MNAFSLSGIVNFVLILIFGFFVFFKDTKSSINRRWLIFSLVGVIWEFGVFKVGITTVSPEASLFWWRIAYIGVILLPVTFTQFVFVWMNIKKNFFYYFTLVFGIIYSSVNIFDIIFNTNFFIPGVRWAFNSFYYNYPQPLYTVFVLIWFFIIIYALFELFKIYKNSIGNKRSQIQYFLLAFFVAYGGGATCYLKVFGIDFYPYPNFTASLYHIIMAYAIVIHRLMDIKMVMRRYSVYLASISLIVLVAIGAKYILTRYFFDVSYWADFIILIIAILIFPNIKNYLFRIANKYFFSSLYDSREVIASLSDKLRSTLDVTKVFDYIYNVLAKAFHIKAFGVLSYDEKNDVFIVQYNKGFNIGKKKNFPGNPELQKMFISQNKTIIVEEARKMYYNKKTKDTIDLLTNLKVEILTPLNVKDKTVGLIALGQKESGDMYNDEDLGVLKIVGAQAAISIENALLYEETLSFNIKLKKEIEIATRELRSANIELKRLDAAKSEFISIASHQLRTPLTVIKGYISMMLEGNFGELSANEEDSLEKVYESSERLIQLVENLLNISRIESGRLQFDYEVMNLEKIVNSVIEDLSNTIKKKKLKLIYNKPAKPLTRVKIDEEKIRQVVLNLIDNAIKYTKKGNITINLSKVKSGIQFCIVDSGMGIRPEDLSNLFKKFSRGKGTSTIHTEGTGLGLYVAKQMVEAHQGKIWAESAGEGKGSKFCFVLPIK